MDSIAALQASINRGFDLSGVYALAAEAQRQKQRQEAMAAMQSERAYRDGIRQQEWARQDARWDEEKAMRDAEIEARQAYETAVREENRSHQQAMQIAQNKFQARMLKERQQWEADQLQMRMDREENQLTQNTQDFLALNQQMQAAQQSALANSLEMAVVDPDVSIYISDKDRKIIDQARQGGSPISSVLGRLSSEAAGAIQTKAADLVQSNQELAMFGEALPLLLRQGVNWSQVAKAMAPKKIVTPNNENEDDDDTSYLNDYGKNNPSAANPAIALAPATSFQSASPGQQYITPEGDRAVRVTSLRDLDRGYQGWIDNALLPGIDRFAGAMSDEARKSVRGAADIIGGAFTGERTPDRPTWLERAGDAVGSGLGSLMLSPMTDGTYTLNTPNEYTPQEARRLLQERMAAALSPIPRP